MDPVTFPEANCTFGPPPGMSECQVATIRMYQGEVERGSVEGAPLFVAAWKPTIDELDRLVKGDPIYLTFLGGVPPHYLSMDFQTAIHPS
jgi:hypothetical protein